MSKFWLRLVNFAAVIAILLVYHQVIADRQRADAQAKAEVEKEYELWKEENSELLQKQEEAQKGGYRDGTYSGKAQGFGGTVEVSVTVSSGAISSIVVQSHEKEDDAYFSMAEDLIPKMIESQTWEVDGVSGATFSSHGIKNAVADALKGAAK